MLKLWKPLLILLCFGACKNEIDIAAPWKETLVVYGLLDPGASVNYIRIQKAFLDPDGNAYQFTQNSDSIYPEKLDVRLYVRENGGPIKDTIFPELVDGNLYGVRKDTGLFASAPNYLYRIVDKIEDSRLSPNPQDFEYELVVKNPKTGYTCSAKTYTTGFLEAMAPVSSNATPITINDKANTFLIYGYREGRKVKAYDMLIRFWYTESSISNPGKTDTLSFNWILFKNRLTESSLRGYEQKISSIPGNIFYELLNSKIKANPDIVRKGLYCDVEYYGAGQDLYTYIEVNVPSIGIIQKKPEYTNISNGLGIFSSRYVTALKKVPLSTDMMQTLKKSDYTKGLNFN